MEAWLISVECNADQEEDKWRVIRHDVLQSDSRPLGKCSRFRVPHHLKAGSLDSLVGVADNLARLDHQLESILKKIERQYYELEPKNPLVIENPNPGVREVLSIEMYLENFQWNNSKYPPSQSLPELTALLEENMRRNDEDLKVKTAKYQESKNMLAAFSKKEGGNLLVKDLAEVLTPQVVQATDFINTDHLKTFCVIVPKKDVDKWLRTYEFLSEGVVPQSAHRFDVTDKDHYTLWRVVVFKHQADAFVAGVRENKWLVREFVFDPTLQSRQASSREEAQSRYSVEKEKLERSCKIEFSDLFIALLHLKAMRVFAESVLRFSLPPKFFSVCVRPNSDKHRRILDSLVKKFLPLGETTEMYGSREETEDGEDFFPFVFVRLTLF